MEENQATSRVVKSPSNRTTAQRRRTDRGRVEMPARSKTNLSCPKPATCSRSGNCLLKGKRREEREEREKVRKHVRDYNAVFHGLVFTSHHC